MPYYFRPQVMNPQMLWNEVDAVHSGSRAIAWMFMLYFGGNIKFTKSGSIDDYNNELDSLRGINGFLYIRYEDYPAKYALVTLKGRRIRNEEVRELAREEVKIIVNKVDFEMETRVPLEFEDIRRNAENRGLKGKRSLIEYLEGLLQKLD